MKAAKRIHAYLDARSTALRGADRQDIASVQNGGEYTQYLRQKDLRKVLRSRDRLVEELKLSRAAQETTQRLLESNIRIYAQQLNLPSSAATAADVLTGIKREQAAVESAREQRSATARELKAASAGLVKMLDDTFSQIRTLYAELGGDPGVLPVNDGPRMLSWLSARIKDWAREYQALRQALREVCAEVLPAYKDKDAGQQLSALSRAVRMQGAVNISENAAPDVIDVLQNALNRSSSRDEPIVMSRGQAWQLLRRAKTEQPGVQAISEARAYQKRVHPPQENKRRELLAAAIALVSGVSALYPFGEDSWEGIRRNGGGWRNQLAHAWACIAALIDLLPSGNVPLQERRIVRDRAAYPGEAGDLW